MADDERDTPYLKRAAAIRDAKLADLERAEQRAWNAFCLVGDFDPDRGEEALRAWHAAAARLEDARLARGDG